MKFFQLLILFALIFSSCNNDSTPPVNAAKSDQETGKQPISIMKPEQAAKELEAIAERELDEFILLYIDEEEKMYIEKNRLIRNIFKTKKNIMTPLTLETITSLRSFIFSAGFYDLPRAPRTADNSKGYVKIQSNKRYNHLIFDGKPSTDSQQPIIKIVQELHRISDSFKAD